MNKKPPGPNAEQEKRPPGRNANARDWLDRAVEHHRAGRWNDAVPLYHRALAIDPDNANACSNLGNALTKLGELDAAVACCRRALAIDPDHAGAHNNLGTALQELGKVEDAAASYRRALAVDPNHAGAYNNLGTALRDLGRLEDAVACYHRALAIDPDHRFAHTNLGNALKDQGRSDEALACHRRALTIDPGRADKHTNLGHALKDRGGLDEAIACYRRALKINPRYAEAHNSLGVAFKEQGKPDEAIACYRRALEINPRYADAHVNLGAALRDGGALEEAVASYRRAVDIDPGHAHAYNNLGNVLTEQEKLAEAIASYRRALDIKPDYGTVAATLLNRLRLACSWHECETLEPKADELLNAELERGEKPGETPFINVTRRADPSQNFAVARSWSRDIARRMSSLKIRFPMDDRRARRPRITIGYLSNDFHNHPTAHLMAGLFGLHDKDAFRIIAYSHGLDDESDYRKRIERDCDKFEDVRGLASADAAKRIYDDRVDILVDLKGHTRGNRFEICGLRPAPIQMTYLGFPGTTGADFIDYIITDRIVTPEDHAGYYSEEFVYLPHCYQVNDHAQPMADTTFKRAELGLPEDAFVFCSFNHTYKIEPVIFATWMNLLKNVPGSVLWLFESNGLAKQNLRRQAEAKGVAADRVVFAGKLPKDQHLARLGLADLALDTRVCNGHTTTSDALWAGVPLVTLQGGHFASRVSASILTAIGLPQLITHSVEEYEALAARLAQESGELSALRQRLLEHRRTEPLFDTPRFVKNLENAYEQAWDIFLTGAKPRRIEVVEGQ